jgi:phage baseplate assembly protein W
MASYVWKSPGDFPWDGTLLTFIEPKDDEEVLRTSIQMILFTRVGERVMLRDFGSNLYRKPFDPNDLFLRNEIIQEVREAVAKWDNRIGIETVNIVQQDHDFVFQIVFFNAKDPFKSTKTFTVTLGEIGFQPVG